MDLFVLGGTIPTPRQFDEEMYVITGSQNFRRSSIYTPLFNSLENTTNPPGSFRGIEGGGRLNEIKYSHQTNGGLSWSIYNSLHDGLRAKYQSGSFFNTTQSYIPVTGLSNFTQVNIRQTFPNNSFVEIAPYYFYGGSYFGDKGGNLKMQFRDPGNQFEFSTEQFLNQQFYPELDSSNTYYSVYRFARINRRFTYGFNHTRYQSNFNTPAFNQIEPTNRSAVFIQWQEFKQGNRFQNKLIRAEWSQHPEDLFAEIDKYGNWTLRLQGLDHNFQTWGTRFAGPLRYSVIRYDEFGSAFYRKISPFIDNLIYWKSDKRKRVYGEISLSNRIHFKRENNQLAYEGKINYIPWPFLRLNAFGSQYSQFNILQPYSSPDSRILFDYYHQKSSYLGVGFYLYPTPRFTLIAQLTRVKQKRSNQQVVELSANGELSDAGISPEPFEANWESGSRLSFQWQMGLLSYFRFDLANNMNTIDSFGQTQQPFSKLNQFNASLIWFFDGPRSSYRDDPKMPRKTR
ncbi:MAG: hypothetical protein R2792_07280 [Saprospiraceae bacterium]